MVVLGWERRPLIGSVHEAGGRLTCKSYERRRKERNPTGTSRFIVKGRRLVSGGGGGETAMRVLAFLQNQWFNNPEKVKRIYETYPDMRNDLVRRFLFMGCLTGRRLEEAFGEQRCGEIVWEEASPVVGGFSASKFPADVKHIANAIIKHSPQVVLAFGQIATNGVLAALPQIQSHPTPLDFQFIAGPHPTARKDPMPRLREMAQRLTEMECSCPT